MELVSEKLFDLYKKEEELKKLIEIDNKKIDKCNEKLQKLLDEKGAINNYLNCCRFVKIIDAISLSSLEGFEVFDLITDLTGKYRIKKVRERKTIINKRMLIIIKTKKNLRAEIKESKEELVNVRKQIREL